MDDRPRRLMVIVPDRVSDWIAKGEVVDRYLNPGSVFDAIDLVLTNDDRPAGADLARLAGGVPVEVHNLPAGRAVFVRTLGWRPALVRRWARHGVALAQRQRPAVVRCHGASLNAVVAAEIKRSLGVPYVVSLHGNPDVDYFRGRRATTPLRRLVGAASLGVELAGLRSADVVLPVYQPIVPYLQRHAITQFEVVPNAVGEGVNPKSVYARGERLRVVCVGRQASSEKDPSALIDAVIGLDDVELLLIGDGDLHDALVTRSAPARDRISFVRAMANDEILRLLPTMDVFAYASENYEVSKGTMEAALAGLPLVLGERPGGMAPELVGDHVLTVPATVTGFAEALARLATDEGERRARGLAARDHAQRAWRPDEAEARVAAIYRALIEDRPAR